MINWVTLPATSDSDDEFEISILIYDKSESEFMMILEQAGEKLYLSEEHFVKIMKLLLENKRISRLPFD